MSFSIDYMGSGDIKYPARVGNLYVAGTITSANGTTPVTCITGAPGYFITELGMQVSPDATITTAGNVNMFFSDSTFGTFFNLIWLVPSTAPAKTQITNLRQTNGPGFYWSAKNSTTTVTFNTDTALTGGSVRWFIRYGLTSIIG